MSPDLEEKVRQLRALIRDAEAAILILEMDQMKAMSYPMPRDCDFIVGNFAVKDLRDRSIV